MVALRQPRPMALKSDRVLGKSVLILVIFDAPGYCEVCLHSGRVD